MPIYEYHCEKCSGNFEFLVLGCDKPECPTCKSPDVNRLLSSCSFFSKGGHGETLKAAAGASSCSGCTATSCSSCGH
ncbi:MAG: FmdB family transcriptional regulator [Desulfobacteraceae bacterium IS3]|nr:MAG: FmdB family transcriptional regulator [Desulfobacteraceae bacterium IS3]HAO22959.1 FmdB family transcriptional regulator [Desulfobacteraceae bacterium]